MSEEWFYFGCGDRAGHYLLKQNGNQAFRYGDDLYKHLGHFDGCLAPYPEREMYVAAMNRLGGLGYSALSWWDRSVDRRPGSNSIIFAPNVTISPEDMLAEAHRRFPWVFARLPRPVTLLAGAST